MYTEEAIQNNPASNKAKAKKAVLFSLGTLAIGTLAFLGIKHFKNKKTDTYDNTNETNSEVDTSLPLPPRTKPVPRASIPAAGGGSASSLNLRDKGAKVLRLQQSLMRAYGSGIFPKYGADGIFGTELRDFLRSKGYAVPLSEADFQKITEEKKVEPLLTFDAQAVSKGLYMAITSKDFKAAITLLKAIKNTSSYAAVSTKLMQYLIGGVRQTLVNAMLNTFTESSQRLQIQQAFLAMGLKYNGMQWSLSGF